MEADGKQLEDENFITRVNAKFEAWLRHNVEGQDVTKVSADRVKKTIVGIIHAELGQLPGAGQRPITTPRTR